MSVGSEGNFGTERYGHGGPRSRASGVALSWYESHWGWKLFLCFPAFFFWSGEVSTRPPVKYLSTLSLLQSHTPLNTQQSLPSPIPKPITVPLQHKHHTLPLESEHIHDIFSKGTAIPHSSIAHRKNLPTQSHLESPSPTQRLNPGLPLVIFPNK